MPSDSLIDEFLAYGVFERHFSNNTVEAYKNDLTRFMHWMEERKTDLLKIDFNVLSEFFSERRIEGHQFSSIARSLFCLRVFFAWLVEKGMRQDNPAELLETPKLWSTLPELLSPSEIDLLIKTAGGKKISAFRNQAMIEVLYGCGLRVSEVVSLKMEDLNLDKAYLICFGKGGKERAVPFGKSTQKALELWFRKGREVLLQKSGRVLPEVFISQKKTPLSRQHVWLELKKIALKAGIQKNIYPHIFRHSYATHILAGGGDLRIVQELLGHADIMTTQKYTQVDKSRMIRQYKTMHPRA